MVLFLFRFIASVLGSIGAIPTGGGCVAAGGGMTTGGGAASTGLLFPRAVAMLRKNLPIVSL